MWAVDSKNGHVQNSASTYLFEKRSQHGADSVTCSYFHRDIGPEKVVASSPQLMSSVCVLSWTILTWTLWAIH